MSWDCASLGPEHQPPTYPPISHCWSVPWQHLPATWACHPESTGRPSFTLTFPHTDACANHVLPSLRARMGQSLPIIGGTWAEPRSWNDRRFQSQGYASVLRFFCLTALLRYNSPISSEQLSVCLACSQCCAPFTSSTRTFLSPQRKPHQRSLPIPPPPAPGNH